jgi:predicted RNase H-like nuclease (RuvC/YqgF family)
VPPLWLYPRGGGPSVGRSYLAKVPPPARQPSAPVLQGQMNELYDLLEHTEKCKMDLHLKWADTNLALAEATEKLHSLQSVHREKAALLNKIETLRKQVNDQKAMIETLKGRLSTLINRWTRFGWNLMPWKKPSWRKQPFK